ncbi:MAG: hypothetical protein IKQ75_06920 [Bacteroidales bacterium]|nr:hypothetical protein [Bacteroidales bacterium]
MKKICFSIFCLMGLFAMLFTSCHYDPWVEDQYYFKNGLAEPIKFLKLDIDDHVYDTITINPGESVFVYFANGRDHSYFSQNMKWSGFMMGNHYCILYSDGIKAYYQSEYQGEIDGKSPALKQFWNILENTSKKHRDEYVVEYTVDEADYQFAVELGAE